MTTLVPRQPYSKDELEKLYPSGLQLQLVQVILRHGERTPVSTRFRNAGLPAYWPYCSIARKMRSAILLDGDGAEWDALELRRQLETFAPDNGPTLATGAHGEVDAMCSLGELTDQGRATTLALGRRLRHLYVDQLGYMPRILSDTDSVYLRATPSPRALESVQQAFFGMYPKSARTADLPNPTIITRHTADETLLPNEYNCKRFAQLVRAFAQRTADRWNDTPEMEHMNKMISKWMPEDSKRVAVDSHPRTIGIMDTVNATLAHPAPTRLPPEFYDKRVRETLDKITVEEWFSGYKESREYRTVGIGGLAADMVQRMVATAERSAHSGKPEEGGRHIRFALSGAHDTTLAAALTAVGAFDDEAWPPFSSHLALELFSRKPPAQGAGALQQVGLKASKAVELIKPPGKGFWAKLWSQDKAAPSQQPIARRHVEDLTDEERSRLDGHYVRIRYNDRILKVPGCAPAGNHLEGDDSFCTLEAFKRIVDKFTPDNWHDACVSNLDKSAFPEKTEPAGW